MKHLSILSFFIYLYYLYVPNHVSSLITPMTFLLFHFQSIIHFQFLLIIGSIFFTCWKDIKTMSKILHCLINERFSTFYVILRILKAKNILLYYILLTNVKFHRLFMAQVARPFFVLDFCQIIIHTIQYVKTRI